MAVQIAVILAMAANAGISVVLAAGEVIPKPYGLLLAAINAGLVVLVNQLPALQHAGTRTAAGGSAGKDLGGVE